MKVQIFLLIALGAYCKVFAQIEDPLKYVLSKDKSKAYIVSVTQSFDASQKKRLVVTNTYDTLKTYTLSNNAKMQITDERVKTLLSSSNKTCTIPDSVVPRWTKIFGKETIVERRLEVVGEMIHIYTTDLITTKPVNYIQKISIPIILSLFVALLFIFSGLHRDMFVYRYKKFLRIIIIVLIIMFTYGLKTTGTTIFDCIYNYTLLFLPLLLLTFIKPITKVSKRNV